jgi:hypothetical protein
VAPVAYAIYNIPNLHSAATSILNSGGGLCMSLSLG